MSGPEGLVTSEGVGEGSAAGTVEDLESHASAGQDVVGQPPQGAPDDEAVPAEPVDMESEQSRQARDAAGPGQQLQSGEG